MQQKGNSIVGDSSSISLDGKTIHAKDFIHLYDSTPYKIVNGHVAAKLPCNANSVSTLNIPYEGDVQYGVYD